MAIHPMRTLTIGASGAVLALALAGDLPAQTIRGTLVDDDTQEAVEGATVHLLGSTRSRIRAVLTDSLGHFTIAVPTPGAYFLEAERIGYGSTRSQSFNVVSVDTVRVTFFISAQAVLLDPLVVGIPTVLGREAFGERSALGRGVFFSPAMVDSLRPTEHVGEILRHTDELFLRWTWSALESGGYGPVPSVRSYRGGGCLHYIVDRTPVPDPFFEGVRSSWGVAPLSEMRPEDLVAVEVYRGFYEIPRDLQRQILANTLGTRRKLREIQRGPCGVVIFWTADGW